MLLASLGLLGLTACQPSVQAGLTSGASVDTFHNPLRSNDSPDPFLFTYQHHYYLTYTEQTQVSLYQSSTLAGLQTAHGIPLWPAQCCHLWAPEVYLLPTPAGQRRWYVYYTRDYGVYVRVSSGLSPLGPYGDEIPLLPYGSDVSHSSAIDPTVLTQQDGRLDLLWSDAGDIYIARLSDPTTLASTAHHQLKATRLPASGTVFGCAIQEAPEVLRRSGRFFVTFSACDAQSRDYKLGMMTAQASSDVLSAAAWTLLPRPVFEASVATGVYGPGHNGFFQSLDGRQNWIVYHAKASAGSSYRGRTARAQSFGWTSDGRPSFGTPVSTATVLADPSGERP
ncbi:family 43 glycosylhydrolase [Deinococcus ruber]|uniref:Alpha-N-arabinofuranosidase n=1 Tax=Deinococcus ruber TaxID=1848197 RepID=A0A918FAT8_9DEIO|nr:family 43 glycosylhydrolase [Deinococcus ruber]GGR22147.1 hypothetical protein GCM10008957_37740 [Deinococcus ruber]